MPWACLVRNPLSILLQATCSTRHVVWCSSETLIPRSLHRRRLQSTREAPVDHLCNIPMTRFRKQAG